MSAQVVESVAGEVGEDTMEGKVETFIKVDRLRSRHPQHLWYWWSRRSEELVLSLWIGEPEPYTVREDGDDALVTSRPPDQEVTLDRTQVERLLELAPSGGVVNVEDLSGNRLRVYFQSEERSRYRPREQALVKRFLEG